MRRSTTMITMVLAIAACAGADESGDAPPTSAGVPASTTGAPPPATGEPAPVSTEATVSSSPATSAPATTVEPSVVTTTPPLLAMLATGGATTPIVLAHAGGDQDYPHSTMFAFAQAAAYADVFEIDVRLTGDGEVVIHHDADTAKTTPESLVVADTDLATLQQLDKAYWWSPECWPCRDLPAESYQWRGVRTGDTPPPDGFDADDFRLITLAELVEAFPQMPLDIEIKGESDEGIAVAEALAEELVELGIERNVVVVAFATPVVDAFHAAAPDVATSPGVDELAAWLLGGTPLADHHDAIQVPPSYQGIEVLTPENLAVMEASGLPIWVWPDEAAAQENEAFYRKLIELGVDGIIAGRPAAARRAIDGAL